MAKAKSFVEKSLVPNGYDDASRKLHDGVLSFFDCD